MLKQFDHPVAPLAQSLLTSEEAAERRREARYPTDDPAELEVLPGPSEPIFGIILDVSRSGLRVALPKRIDRGEQVKVKLYRNVIFGDVRYCRSISGAFHAGIRIKGLVFFLTTVIS